MTFVAGEVLTAARLNDEIEGPVRTWVGKAGSSDQSGISAITDITGCSVTWTADATRIYKYTAVVDAQKITSANVVSLYITTGANAGVIAGSASLALNEMELMMLTWTETGLSGSQTRKLRIESSASGTVTVVNSFSRNAILIVEDVGPTT